MILERFRLDGKVAIISGGGTVASNWPLKMKPW